MKRNQALFYTVSFAVVGLFITALVAFVERETLSTYQQNLPFISLGDNIKNRTTNGHLWFEELMAGDGSIDFQKDVIVQFEKSRSILQGAYDGSATELGTFEEPDMDTKELIKMAIIEIDALVSITHERWRAKQQSFGEGEEAGGLLDDKFDVSYQRVQANMDKLIEHIHHKVKADSQYLNILSWISIVLVFGIFVFLGFMIYRLQRTNDRMAEQNQKKLDEESKRAESLASFIEKVSSGDFSVQLATDENDGLTSRLIKMRDTLKENAANDQIRNWATTGQAQIGEILRNSSGNTTQLYDSIIKFVVQYTKSNQGGLFLLNDDDEHDQYLELASCYAFERKKFITKRLDTGQGLVGQCFTEGQRIYLLEVPEGYVHITSGLGGTKPNALLLIPMKVNEDVFGVIELASFKKYEEYEIELVEKFAESIASTISSVKVNESTRMLLERTQQQAEEMRSQEEEMRQNMEELSATQEEMARKEKEYINRIRELEEQIGVSSR